ncbi:restriction endonuclease subunit S [Maribacter dokdonensis]|uniref:restriction endonuclease subunit S n=1 Tax=Maribacter dokdonensis TaxID=320912 RepID=UPI001C096A2E|nr:restriction endonuclease subunit S [Maribacter dokdonensis]MBU2901555.1 restriction endonuclease subunit S [Maribacter dokdonensis]
MSKKKSKKLGEIGKVVMCKRVLKHQTSDKGDIPFYKISTFGQKPENYISRDLYKSFKKKYNHPKKGDVLISAAGTVGKTVIYDGEPAYFQDSNIVWIDNDETEITNGFLYYFYQTEPWLTTNGSTIKRIYNDDLRNIIITFPSLKEQKKIAKVLSDLDAKIEVNNKINQELEVLAKTIYDYWFVQFDFPYVTSSGVEKPYKSSGGKMVYNEELKREIPEGWEDGVLSDIADITMGQSPSGSSYNEEGIGTVFYQGSTDFGSRFPTIRQYTSEPSRMAQEGDILLSVRAPVGTMNQAMEDCCIGRGLAALREKEGSISYLWSQMVYFKQIFDRKNASGTTFGAITKNELFGLKVCIPKKEILEKFKEKVDPFHDKIVNNSKENQKLAALRDWLLPMLMNGQVTVGEAKEQLGMVAEEGEKYKTNQ